MQANMDLEKGRYSKGSGYGVVLPRRQGTSHGFAAVSCNGYGYGNGAAMQKSRIWTWGIATRIPEMENRCVDKDNGVAADEVWPRIWSTCTWMLEFSVTADLDMALRRTDEASIYL